jgi:hypothetical protein
VRHRLASLVFAGLLLAGCVGPYKPGDDAADPRLDRLTRELDQNWSSTDIEWFNDINQGSRLVPRAWFEALEQPRGGEPFAAANHIGSYRYLPRDGKLPVGFTEDRQSDAEFSPQRTRLRWFAGQGEREPWVGMTCAACHTGTVRYRNQSVAITGGAPLADYQGFIAALNESLGRTAADDARFDRFATKVLAARDTPGNRALLRDALGRLVTWQGRIVVQNAQEPDRADRVAYGPGRLDALGHILNKMALASGAATTPVPSDAPVSYPALWNTPQLDRVEWNGLVRNTRSRPGGPDLGALMRNAGQTLGVFGDYVPHDRPLATRGFRSSVESAALVTIERSLNTLRPPAWPASLFGPIDAAKSARGKALFADRCASCHSDAVARDNLAAPMETKLVYAHEIGTDITMTCNVYSSRVPTGVMRTVRDKLYIGGRLQAVDAGLSLMQATILSVLLAETGQIQDSASRDAIGRPRVMTVASPTEVALADRATRNAFCLEESKVQEKLDAAGKVDADHARLTYKARPLAGVWATAPYLHNGSVPTLYDLLLPPEKRPTRFLVGSADYDPAKVGYMTTRSPDNSFEFRTDRPGNSNAGHVYGTDLKEDDRTALIEYLKSL